MPYFATRAWEDRGRVGFRQLTRTVTPLVVASVLLSLAAWQASQATSDAGDGSPPLVVTAASLPFLLVVPYLLAVRSGWFGRTSSIPSPVPAWSIVPLLASSGTLAWLAWFGTSESGRTSPPLIVIGALLPFLVAIPLTLMRRRRAAA